MSEGVLTVADLHKWLDKLKEKEVNQKYYIIVPSWDFETTKKVWENYSNVVIVESNKIPKMEK